MIDTSKINSINKVISNYFEKNPDVSEIKAKELMPEFIAANIFSKDHREGLPIRQILRELDAENKLGLIPHLRVERKAKNRLWFFHR